MFGKGKGGEEEQAPESAPAPQPQRLAVAKPAAKPETVEEVSSISSGMTIVGKLVGDGVVKIFGRVEGEIHASTILISDGAQVEGNIVAQELTVAGRVKGTIHANRVALNSTAIVEGDIFHRSLAIEENARFEGTSRREDNVIDAPSSAHVRKSSLQPQAQPQAVLIDGSGKFRGASDNEELYKSAQ